MTLCPIALLVTCNKCFAVGFCPLKESLGDYKPEAKDVEVAKPEATDGEAAKPEAKDVEAAKPEATDGEAAKPEAKDVEVAKPAATDKPAS